MGRLMLNMVVLKCVWGDLCEVIVFFADLIWRKDHWKPLEDEKRSTNIEWFISQHEISTSKVKLSQNLVRREAQ